MSWWQSRCRQLVLGGLRALDHASLTVTDPAGSIQFGPPQAARRARIEVHDARLYPMIVRGGSLAAAEAYIRGYWHSDQLVQVMRILARHATTQRTFERAGGRLLGPVRAAANVWRRNSRAGSRRNIAAHYDLSNDFFQLWLDPTMTYSCGYFRGPSDTLQQASLAKYERICQKLQLTADDHVLEIGCGWGGFALYAASRYGCRITATTISGQQLTEARRRLRQTQLEDRVQLVQQDYRDLTGQYDKLVSIEMIEAVGEAYLDRFFAQCCRLLKPEGLMVLQGITMPDYRYDAYRHSLDFVRRYVFPGGFLPSLAAIGQALRRGTDLQLVELKDLTAHYANTLAHWRTNFWQRIDQVRQLGFDERFIRTWNYYLCYCEAGFAERQTGVSQMVLVRPERPTG
jgi:cyclopropane-fatty-acyl-phospholipid synthase